MSEEKTLRRWVVSVGDGCVVLDIPWPLTAEDRSDILDWMDLVRRQIGRDSFVAHSMEQKGQQP